MIDGDEHMRKRPIGPLIAALKAVGIEASAPTGCPPVIVVGGGGFAGGRVVIDAALSSQYVSAMLMASAGAKGPVEIVLHGADIGARGYVDLTLATMRQFGGEVSAVGNHPAWVVQPTGYRAADVMIEPDASAATYIWAAEALTGGAINVDFDERIVAGSRSEIGDTLEAGFGVQGCGLIIGGVAKQSEIRNQCPEHEQR